MGVPRPSRRDHESWKLSHPEQVFWAGPMLVPLSPQELFWGLGDEGFKIRVEIRGLRWGLRVGFPLLPKSQSLLIVGVGWGPCQPGLIAWCPERLEWSQTSL